MTVWFLMKMIDEQVKVLKSRHTATIQKIVFCQTAKCMHDELYKAKAM